MKHAKKKKTSPLLITLIVLFILVIIGCFFFIKVMTSPSQNSRVVEITIEENSYGKQVLKTLENDNVIKNADVVYYYARLKELNMDFKAGTYKVDTSWSLKELFDYISNATNAIQETITIKFTEGSRVKDFAYKLSDCTNLEYQDIIDTWNDESYIRSLMNNYSFLTEEALSDDIKYYLEGYLFPDTYEFFPNTTIDEVTNKILSKTEAVYQKYKNNFDNNEYSVHEIFTLASIIQRESGNKEDMKNVSSVFNNRLDIGMGLQSSVTVCYALDIGINEDWTKCEIIQEDRDPYNTYQFLGFPPGGICSPSEDAIEAALNPNETDYYYFIGDVCGDGTSYFAKTYAEQLQNQARYLTCY